MTRYKNCPPEEIELITVKQKGCVLHITHAHVYMSTVVGRKNITEGEQRGDEDKRHIAWQFTRVTLCACTRALCASNATDGSQLKGPSRRQAWNCRSRAVWWCHRQTPSRPCCRLWVACPSCCLLPLKSRAQTQGSAASPAGRRNRPSRWEEGRTGGEGSGCGCSGRARTPREWCWGRWATCGDWAVNPVGPSPGAATRCTPAR